MLPRYDFKLNSTHCFFGDRIISRERWPPCLPYLNCENFTCGAYQSINSIVVNLTLNTTWTKKHSVYTVISFGRTPVMSNKHVSYAWTVPAGRTKTSPAPYLKTVSTNMKANAINETETSRPCLMANCNSGDYCITCTPCKTLWVKSDEICQIK